MTLAPVARPILWGRGSSTNVQKVLWALGELGIDAERRVVGGEHGGTDSPAFRALNPNGTVPVWQEGSLVLWESHAILRHLARQSGQLYGEDATTIAHTDQWLDWTAQVFWPPVRLLFLDVFRAGLAPAEVRGAPEALERTRQTLAVAEAAFTDGATLDGDRPTIAAIALGIALHRLVGLDMGIELPTRLGRWHARMKSRPAFSRGTQDEPPMPGHQT